MHLLFICVLLVFPTETDQGVNIEFWGDFSEIEGTICSIKNPGQHPFFSLVANKSTKVSIRKDL